MKSAIYKACSLLAISILLLVSACGSSGGGGSSKSSALSKLIITLDGGASDTTVVFDGDYQATVYYTYAFGESAPTTGKVVDIAVSDKLSPEWRPAEGEAIPLKEGTRFAIDATDESSDGDSTGQLVLYLVTQNGTSRPYTITFVLTEGSPSSDTTINNLTLDVGGFSQAVSFNQELTGQIVREYDQRSDAPNKVTIQNLDIASGALAFVGDQTLDIDESGVVSNDAGRDITGDAALVIRVKAQDDSTADYTVNFEFKPVEPNSLKELTSLAITIGGESRDNISFDYEYKASVAYEYARGGAEPTDFTVDSIAVSPEASSSTQASSTISIVDSQAIITVTAADDSTRDYTISFDFSEAAADSNTEIQELVLNIEGQDKTLTFGDFDDFGRALIDHVYDTTADTLSVSVSKLSLSSGEATSDVESEYELSLSDPQTISITVTAGDGTTRAAYSINVRFRPKSDAKDLIALSVQLGGVSMDDLSFDSGHRARVVYEFPYRTEIPTQFSITSISVSEGASYDVTLDSLLDISGDSATITVTAEDDSTRTYSISFDLSINPKSPEKEITNLEIMVAGNTADVTFDSNHESTIYRRYSVFPDPFRSINVTVVNIEVSHVNAQPNVLKGGTASVLVDKSGDQYIAKYIITVTAEDASTRDYTINFVFQEAKNTRADIESLKINFAGSDGDETVDVDFGGGTEASVYYLVDSGAPASVTIVELSLSDGAKATESGKSDAIGDTATLTDDNKVIIVVTPEDGDAASKTYTINFVARRLGLRDVISSTTNGGAGNGLVPPDLSRYDELTQTVLAPYTRGDMVHPIYITMDGSGTQGGITSWSDAAPRSELKSRLDDLSDDASARHIYLLLIASSGDASYDTGDSGLRMQNHVAIVGGWDASGGWGRSGTTVLSGGGTHSVINNDYTTDKLLTNTALLYGVSIEDGSAESGGGIYNHYASPVLTNVTVANNSAATGGGIYNLESSPILTNVTIASNSSTNLGGGIYNFSSSPVLTNVTIASNSATNLGGGISNLTGSSPVLTNVTIYNNSAATGGGIFNLTGSSSVLINVTIANNRANNNGGGISSSNSSPFIVNSILWGNTATSGTSGTSGTGQQIYSDGEGTITTLAYSLLQGGANAIGLGDSVPTIVTAGISDGNPVFGDLTTDAGSLVPTMAIGQDSSADDLGVYVRRHTDPSGDTTYYYSEDEDEGKWYTDFTSDTDTSSGLTGTPIFTANLPADSTNPVATDATGKAREARPDAGAYEYISESAAP